jgi:hypothetical protein
LKQAGEPVGAVLHNIVSSLGPNVSVSLMGCFVICLAIIQQGGKFYFGVGISLATPGFRASSSVGLANAGPSDRSCGFVQGNLGPISAAADVASAKPDPNHPGRVFQGNGTGEIDRSWGTINGIVVMRVFGPGCGIK